MAIAAPYYVLFIMKLLSFVKDTKIINEACLDLSLFPTYGKHSIYCH